MKKIHFALLFVSLIATSLLSAGDVATFVEKGFSPDGKSYVFGQYGRTDNKFQGWAEIYHVDIASNDYVDGGVFKINPTAVTAEKKGNEVFESLEAKSFFYLKNINCQQPGPEEVLYICDDPKKKGNDEIVFKDFNGSKIDAPNTYHVQLYPTVIGSGKDVKSSFFILLEVEDADGKVLLRKKIGSPEIVRKGISGYKVERIVCDKSGKSMVFVIEKMMEDSNGTSVRYMVEAVAL